MDKIEFRHLAAGDEDLIRSIAAWYHNEWSIPVDHTCRQLSGKDEMQVLLQVNGEYVATAGIYTTVGIFALAPELKEYKNWMALVYTLPLHRNKGYGSLLCNYIAAYAKQTGSDKLYLFTHTAASLYRRLGWRTFKQINHQEKSIEVMEKVL